MRSFFDSQHLAIGIQIWWTYCSLQIQHNDLANFVQVWDRMSVKLNSNFFCQTLCAGKKSLVKFKPCRLFSGSTLFSGRQFDSDSSGCNSRAVKARAIFRPNLQRNLAIHPQRLRGFTNHLFKATVPKSYTILIKNLIVFQCKTVKLCETVAIKLVGEIYHRSAAPTSAPIAPCSARPPTQQRQQQR